jgi:hypothetical protein
MDKLKVEALARAYLKLRDARAARKRAFETEDRDLAAKQQRISSAMLAFLAEHGIDSAATESGTFYRQEDLTPTGADWEAFYAWVRENNAFDALERRIKKTFIRQYIEEHEGEIPPGVNVYREYSVHVRRPT